MCVQFLYILFVRLCMGERASEPLCLSDITAQQSMTGGEATSGGEMWVILPTLLAPLFIPSAPRVWLLFHRWRRHPAVISLLLPVVFFFFFCGTVVFLHAGSNWMILVLWVTLFFRFEFYDSWGWQWFSLWRGTLSCQALCTHSTSAIQLHICMRTCKQESWDTASEKILVNLSLCLPRESYNSSDFHS